MADREEKKEFKSMRIGQKVQKDQVEFKNPELSRSVGDEQIVERKAADGESAEGSADN